MFNIFKKKAPVNLNTKKIQLKISGMHCVSCSLNIDGELEDLDGVMSATTSYAKSICEVEFDPIKMDEAKILKVIQSLGYTVI